MGSYSLLSSLPCFFPFVPSLPTTPPFLHMLMAGLYFSPLLFVSLNLSAWNHIGLVWSFWTRPRFLPNTGVDGRVILCVYTHPYQQQKEQSPFLDETIRSTFMCVLYPRVCTCVSARIQCWRSSSALHLVQTGSLNEPETHQSG